MKKILILTLFIVFPLQTYANEIYQSQPIFPYQSKHVHSSSIVECPNGDLFACWFQGSGERSSNDVKIQGARLKKGSDQWSEVFLMADTPNLPDCNPVLFIDRNQKLWMFWIAVRANGWQHSILRYRTSTNYQGDLAPEWDWQDLIVLKPGEEFSKDIENLFKQLNLVEGMWAEYALPYTELIVEAAKDKNKRQEGWMTRIHPLQLDSGRFLLPLYSDGFNISLIGISDDDGKTWQASKPIVGVAGIQPSLIQKQDGTIKAYMRDTGDAPYRVLISESNDNGITWTPAIDTDIPNPGSSLEVLKLQNGLWAMIYNDTEYNRDSLAISLSDDEGKTWKWKRHIGQGESYGYPSIIQDKQDLIHITYTYKQKQGNTINHDVMNIDWIKNAK
jgi:predicted neuraminidase